MFPVLRHRSNTFPPVMDRAQGEISVPVAAFFGKNIFDQKLWKKARILGMHICMLWVISARLAKHAYFLYKS